MIVTQNDFHSNPFSGFRHTSSRKSPLLRVILLCQELHPFIIIIQMAPSICDAFDYTHVQYINDTLHINRSVFKPQFIHYTKYAKYAFLLLSSILQNCITTLRRDITPQREKIRLKNADQLFYGESIYENPKLFLRKHKGTNEQRARPKAICFLSSLQTWRYQTQSWEPVHEISHNDVCATSKASDQPAHTRSLIRAFASPLSIL